MSFDIPFNEVAILGKEIEYLEEAVQSKRLCGGGLFAEKCEHYLEDLLGCKRSLLVPSCTHALEMAAILIDVRPGDEIIMPSFTFVSTANAFMLRGASVVFVDVKGPDMNIDVDAIKSAVTNKTKAIVPVHYAGASCDMRELTRFAHERGIYVIEDAAQAIFAKYENKYLGTFGDMSAFSFHETKNLTSGGEGGALVINNDDFVGRAEVIREKGTNRAEFLRGDVDKYTWRDIGSSFLASELQAAFLLAQLEKGQEATERRNEMWNLYRSELTPLLNEGLISVQETLSGCSSNAHMFFIKTKSQHDREALRLYLGNLGIGAVSHYIPLHNAPYGIKHTRFVGRDLETTNGSQVLLRLPISNVISGADVQVVARAVRDFYAV